MNEVQTKEIQTNPSIATIHPDLLDAAELQQGGAAGFPWAQAPSEVLLDLHLQMEPQFLVKLVVDIAPMKSKLNPIPHLAKHSSPLPV